MKLAICGAGGRMGRAVARLAAGAGATLVGAADAPGAATIGRDVGELCGSGTVGVAVSGDIGAALLGADVVVDFSSPKALPALLAAAVRSRVAVVSGTTGLDAAAERALDEAARSVPVLWSPNMSVGVHVLAQLVAQAVRMLGADFDVEIVETHHRAKVDAPSGTAKRLLDAVREARSDLTVVHGREGIVGARPDREVAVVALRGGDVIGDHSVHLLGAGERIELTHRATNRELFAQGALRAARAIAGRAPGRYTMSDVVG